MENIENEKIRVLLFDCDRFELATLADSLRLQGLDVVGQAFDRESSIALYKAVSPDSIIINFQGCDQPSIELLEEMRIHQPDLGIVLLTDSPDLRLYGIDQESLPQRTQLIEKSALTDLHQLRSAVELSMQATSKTGWIANQWSAALSSLTDIQIETLRLLAQGLSNSDIGKVRFVSEKSVEQTITRIAQHLNVVHQKGRNMRVILATEYFKWIGTPRMHGIKAS